MNVLTDVEITADRAAVIAVLVAVDLHAAAVACSHVVVDAASAAAAQDALEDALDVIVVVVSARTYARVDAIIHAKTHAAKPV